jgi:phosphoglycerate dehydrogenase-like enzyme
VTAGKAAVLHRLPYLASSRARRTGFPRATGSGLRSHRAGLEGPRLCRPVPETPARLLVALKSRDVVAESLNRGLPGVPWCYAGPEGRGTWDSVEALLVGSVERELGPFESKSTPRLEFVQRLYTGVDGFPFDRFPEQVRIAGNVGGYAPFVAEHAVMLALAAARALVPVQVQVRAGALRPAPEVRLLFGRTAVILGYGEIGRAIARRLAGFEMRIVGMNRSGRTAPGCSTMFSAEHLTEAVAEGDVVFDARPLTVSTAATMGDGQFAAMRPDAIYVNVGRAGTVDEEALYRHLTSHPGFRAALDVWWEEDYAHGTFASRFPLAGLPNFVGTPHCAGFGPSVEAYVLERAIENLARYFRGEAPLYIVDRREYVPATSGK